MDDVIVGKVASLQRCISRARAEYAASQDFANDFTHQDAAILNVLRACEQAIDLAAHIIRTRKLGIPADSREAFKLLYEAQIITSQLFNRLSAMVGFRNAVVHTYQKMDIAIVIDVIQTGLSDLLQFTDIILALA